MTHELERRPWITAVAMDTPQELAGAMRRLRAMGITRVSCIGGRTLARQLLDAHLVDDLYLTTSAMAGGEPNTPLTTQPIGGKVLVRKHGTGADAGMTFVHVGLR